MTDARHPRLADLLEPIGVDTFFAEYFEKKFVHLPRRVGVEVPAVSSLERIERTLWEHGDRLADFAKVRRADAWVPPPSQQAFHWIRHEFNRGASIVVNHLQRYDARFARFHRQFEQDLRMPVAANAYLTPAGARTFTPHFDSHDTFVLHLHGTKTWRIHGTAVESPMRHHEGPLHPSTLGSPVAEIVLRPGDVLYIPRGMVHWASAHDEPSLHVTLGWYPARPVDLLHELVRLAADATPQLRRGFTPDALHREGGPSLADALRHLADFAERGGATAAATSRWLDKHVAKAQVVPDGGLFGRRPPPELGADDWLERHAGLPCRVEVREGRARVAFGGYPDVSDDERPASFAGPEFLAPTLAAIVAGTEPFQPRSLPGPLSDDAKVLLARQLLEAGLLRWASPPATRPVAALAM